MDLHFGSAEQPNFARYLERLGVRHVAISFYEWHRRHSAMQVYRQIPESMKVIITSGAARKELDFTSLAEAYVDFAEHNADECLIYDFDAPACPLEVRRWARDKLSALPNFVVFPFDEETHADLARTYERIGVNANSAKSIPPNELRRIAATLYGSNITSPKTLRQARFAATTSLAWLGPRRYGELWLFNRGHLRHFTADERPRAVRSHRDIIEAFSVDPEACAANDRDALTDLAVKSLQAMAESLSGRPRDRQRVEIAATSSNDGVQDPVEAQGPGGVVPAQNHELVPRGDDMRVLPLFRKDELGQLRSKPDSARMCDSCNLSEHCPAYKPSSACAFEIPVEIKSDAEWEAAMQVVLEWQFQRISFGVFSEQANGGELTSRVGQEMDRFSKLLASVKEMKASDRAQHGVLSKLLAEEGALPAAGETHGQETSEEDEDDVEIIDAELVDIGAAGWDTDSPSQD